MKAQHIHAPALYALDRDLIWGVKAMKHRLVTVFCSQNQYQKKGICSGQDVQNGCAACIISAALLRFCLAADCNR